MWRNVKSFFLIFWVLRELLLISCALLGQHNWIISWIRKYLWRNIATNYLTSDRLSNNYNFAMAKCMILEIITPSYNLLKVWLQMIFKGTVIKIFHKCSKLISFIWYGYLASFRIYFVLCCVFMLTLNILRFFCPIIRFSVDKFEV